MSHRVKTLTHYDVAIKAVMIWYAWINTRLLVLIVHLHYLNCINALSYNSFQTFLVSSLHLGEKSICQTVHLFALINLNTDKHTKAKKSEVIATEYYKNISYRTWLYLSNIVIL